MIGRAALAVACAVAVGGCQRERRDFIAVGHRATARDARAFRDPSHGLQGLIDPYPGSAWAVAEGRRLYEWFNCVGCHAHGGGGMGPPLTAPLRMVGGASAEAIFAVIVGGTPAGMPAYGERLTDADVWKLVAYVRSLSQNEIGAVRNDEMQATRDTGASSGARAPGSELGALRAGEDEALERYGWVDRSSGVVRIPIERAMELLVGRRGSD